MAKIKLTKSELKSQRDSMKQFQRFLPTLLLKKQQLQMEMRNCQARLRENEAEEKALKEDIMSWISVLGGKEVFKNISSLISLTELKTSSQNIAGVEVPIFESAVFKEVEYDLFIEPLWYDSAIDAIKKTIEIKAAHKAIEEQYRLIQKELQTTTQRVNLFEKIKIPECKSNIRVIQIYLGDQQTAAVGRSKIAKRKMQEGEVA